jgi:uncharacterized tellurite resistance protein B-like protein
MFKTIQHFFESQIQPAEQVSEARSEHSLELATAALLIELTRADFKVEETESRAVEDGIARVFDLSREETDEIIRLAQEQASQSLSIYEFTHLIDRSLPIEKKIHIVELLWRVAFSDAELEQHEEYLIRKISKLLHVRHEDFIDAKIRAREYMHTKHSKE